MIVNLDNIQTLQTTQFYSEEYFLNMGKKTDKFWKTLTFNKYYFR